MLQNRPPIVVVLGHVDHGKTSLLDALNKTNVAAREAGGITQSTRAFQLNTENRTPITFIDTPGHAAFTKMRSRGGQVADIAILVVSAVDGVMPQTKESIQTIQAAKIPMIVAINKIDVAGASAETVKSQLVESGVTVESYGGTVPSVEISAKTGQGLPELLDLVLLVNDLNPAQTDPEKILQAVVLESSLDPHKGSLATLIVKDGTLHQGDAIYLGDRLIGKARSLSVDPALPSTPVDVSGLSEVPPVGSILSTQSLNNITSPPPLNLRGGVGGGDIESGVFKIILKADVAGSLEAITYSLPPEVKILVSGTGDITESDILAASPLKIKVLGFNVRVSNSTLKLAEIEKVAVKTFNIIYELLDYVDQLVHPKVTESVTGKAEIIAEFKIEGVKIAGCKCSEGQILKTDTVRVGGKDVKIKSLKFGKAETEKVKLGQEFGIIFSPYVDFKVGESIIAIQIHG